MVDFHVVIKVEQAARSHVDWANIYAEAFGADSERPDLTMVCRECSMLKKG